MFRRMSAFWRRRSLKCWLATGMLMTYCPVFIAAVAGYVYNQQALLQPLLEVAAQQRHILQPLQRLQLSVWEVSDSVTDFAVDGRPDRVKAYHGREEEIDAALGVLAAAGKDHEWLPERLREARSRWQEVAGLSRSMFSGPPLQGEPAAKQRVEQFEASLVHLGSTFRKIYDDLRVENQRTHDRALADVMRWERWGVAGLVVSILGAVLGIFLINRSLVSSMDRLAAGAVAVAAGDREHRIEVEIPRELVSVADTFNLMTQRIRQQEEELARAAKTDGLTGLSNRCEFDRMLDEEIRRAERYGRSVSVIMSDIDHFKNFNDTRGHQAGDEALRQVARTLKEGLRAMDKACRYGGEEFVLILPESGAEAAREVAERVRAAVEAREICLDGEQTAKVTVSLGVASYPDNGATPEALLKSADMALYRAKENGRNRVISAV